MYEIKAYQPEKKSAPSIWTLYKQRNADLMADFNTMQEIACDIRDYLSPRSAVFQGEEVTSRKRQDLKIINSRPRFAVRTLASGMQSGVTNPSRPWFKLGFSDPDLASREKVKEWLYFIERLILDVLSRSNVYDRIKSNYGTMGTYGTGAFFLEEDDEDIIRGFDFPFGSFRLAQAANGKVNTMFRDVSLTTEQAIEKFGSRSPAAVKLSYDRGDYYTRRSYVHIIEPNRLYDENLALSHNKKHASVWFDCTQDDESSILSYKGYDHNPLMAPRWDLFGESVWGIGCGEFALGDSKQIQLMEKRKLQGIDKNVNPTMVADASLRNQRTSMLPGDTTYVNGLIATGNQGYRPAYQANPYITELREEINGVGERIDEAFYKNLFLTILDIGDQPNITATQINAMREEKLQMLGPVLERLNDELLDPLIDAIFSILQKNGMIPPAPEEIQGMPIKVEYISILAQAQKAMGIGNIERFIGFVGNLAAGNPKAGLKLNVNEAIDAYADMTSVPPKIINSNDKVEEMVQAETMAAQRQNMLENAQPLSQAAKNVSEMAQASGGQIDMNKAREMMGGVNG